MSPLPILLVAHIALAIALFLPSFLLPFALRSSRRERATTWLTNAPHGRFVRTLLWLQGNGTLVIGLGVALTGVALLAVLGTQLLSQPWLLIALSIYALNLALAFFIQRPNLRRLLRLPAGADDEERERWRDRARRQRYVSYLMAAAIGLIAFLMSTKPRI